MNKDLTDKEILALGVKTPKIKKRVLFKEYTGTYINLGLTHKDAHTMKQELVAVAKRGAELIMQDILRKTKMPTKLPKHQQPMITIIIYPGVADTLEGRELFIYPSAMEDYKLEEV